MNTTALLSIVRSDLSGRVKSLVQAKDYRRYKAKQLLARVQHLDPRVLKAYHFARILNEMRSDLEKLFCCSDKLKNKYQPTINQIDDYIAKYHNRQAE